MFADTLPCEQPEQPMAPVASAKVPAAQLTHSLAPWPEENLPCTQSEQLIAPTPVALPRAQLTQAVAAVVPTDVPAPHWLHEAADAAEKVPGKQAAQSEDAALPVEPWYKPAGHRTQAVAPAASWYLPVPQTAQSAVAATASDDRPAAQFEQLVAPACI